MIYGATVLLVGVALWSLALLPVGNGIFPRDSACRSGFGTASKAPSGPWCHSPAAGARRRAVMIFVVSYLAMVCQRGRRYLVARSGDLFLTARELA